MIVAVVGSANVDLVATLAQRPAPGETVLGETYWEVVGGKGVNQALASAAVSPTHFVASLGPDSAATAVREVLERGKVLTTYVATAEVPTGRAMITVTPEGENSIVVIPLANLELRADQVLHALNELRPKVVAMQLELTDEVVVETARWCAQNSARLVLNASPYRTLPRDVIAAADPLIVNAGEAAAVLGLAAPHGDHPTITLARSLSEMAVSALLTAGAEGVYVVEDGEVHHVPTQRVEAVDTTGAGDAFAGTVAGHLARGVSLLDAAADGNAVASRLVQVARRDR